MNKEIIVNAAKDFFEAIGYPISKKAKFDYFEDKKELLVTEKLRQGETTTRMVIFNGGFFSFYAGRIEPEGFEWHFLSMVEDQLIEELHKEVIEQKGTYKRNSFYKYENRPFLGL